MITEERYKTLTEAMQTGANLAPIDFKNIDEYETGIQIKVVHQKNEDLFVELHRRGLYVQRVGDQTIDYLIVSCAEPKSISEVNN